MTDKPTIPYDFIRPVIIGLFFSFGAIIFGEFAGLAFNKYGKEIRETYSAKVKSHKKDVFREEWSLKGAITSTWIYTKRFHYHAMGLGTLSIAMILLLSISWVSDAVKRFLSIGIGAGGFLFPIGWFLLAIKISYMGKSAAEKSLEFLILGCIGLHVLSVIAVMLIYLAWLIYKDKIPGFLDFLK